MDALRRSVAADKAARPQSKKSKPRVEGQREMLLPIAGQEGKENGQARRPLRCATEEGRLRSRRDLLVLPVRIELTTSPVPRG